jgi:ElaB/YqjD/DUF883 family membrane-anchored ribosome-binding protein
MVNQQVLAHHWDEVRDKLREKYDRLADDDLPTFPGNIDQLIGRIEQKTGVSREKVEAYLSELTEEGKGMIEQVRVKASQSATKVADAARQRAESVRETVENAGDVIRERPGQSLIAAFGIGMVCGLGVALLVRSRQKAQPTAIDRGRSMLDDAYSRGRGAYATGRETAGRLSRQLRESLDQYLHGH